MLRERTQSQLKDVLATGAVGTMQNRSERDTFADMYANRLARLWAVERGLVFGRLDHTEEGRLYIGKLGLTDDEQERLLIDWRAPVAQPFYRATPAAPMGVTRRRHLQTRGRTVVGVDDDLLDLDGISEADRATLNGEAALLAALDEKRTGRMRDIVATIQAEQDRVIRADLNGVLVVQGGPGTGKTVVALHRAAYLLYTHRERLERRGVLILGPNLTFLRYIEQVLPSLGETDVLLSTVGELYPGLNATARDRPPTAALKGDIRMAEVIARAVRDRQRVQRKPVQLPLGRYTLTIEPGMLDAARNKAVRSRRPHNQARTVFVRSILNALARQAAKKIGKGLIDDEELADLRADPAELGGAPAAVVAYSSKDGSITQAIVATDTFPGPVPARCAKYRAEVAGAKVTYRTVTLKMPARGERSHAFVTTAVSDGKAAQIAAMVIARKGVVTSLLVIGTKVKKEGLNELARLADEKLARITA
ncbi:DNA/RNA helicase domain-containing protein [Nonomuraea sp. NPDC055795]